MAVNTTTRASPESLRSGVDQNGPPSGAGTTTPLVDLRVVLFTVTDGALLVACPNGPAGPQLPRGEPTPSEPLDTSARRIVQAATGVQEQYLEQLYTLSVRDPPAW